jgi:hypothetical protein
MALPSGDPVNLRGILVDVSNWILSHVDRRLPDGYRQAHRQSASLRRTAPHAVLLYFKRRLVSESSISALQGRSLHGAFGLLKCKTSP